MTKFGCTKKFIRMIRFLYDDMLCYVSVQGEDLELFSVRCYVRLCTCSNSIRLVLCSCSLISLTDFVRSIRFCVDGGVVFNLARLKSHTKVRNDVYRRLVLCSGLCLCLSLCPVLMSHVTDLDLRSMWRRPKSILNSYRVIQVISTEDVSVSKWIVCWVRILCTFMFASDVVKVWLKLVDNCAAEASIFLTLHCVLHFTGIIEVA